MKDASDKPTGLSMVPAAKLADPARARAGLARLAELDVDLLLVGDGVSILHAGGAASFDLPRELLGVTLRARDLQRAAPGEAQWLPGLIGERRELRHRALGELGQRGCRADLAREAGGAGRGLGGERGALEHDHAQATPRT
jgi:hypothetical protein